MRPFYPLDFPGRFFYLLWRITRVHAFVSIGDAYFDWRLRLHSKLVVLMSSGKGRR